MNQGSSASAEPSVQGSALPLAEKIRRARYELLDLSTRNRLIHTPRNGKARIVEVVNELAVAMYKTLVIDEKRFTFTPGRVEAEETPDLGDDLLASEVDLVNNSLDQPDTELDEQGRVATHWDLHLATRLTSAGLQKRLLDLYTDAKTLQEEQGVNILYLAIGYLRWRDKVTPDIDRYAPLVLVPVALERSTAGDKFHLRWSGDEIQANLSLQAFLSRQYGLKLPEIPDFETLDIDAYLAEVAVMASGREHWEVLPNDAVLGLFSFAKFMMYRDLDPEQWIRFGGFESIATLRGVVSDGFPHGELHEDDANIDPLIPPADMLHVMDCDSSQSLVVHDVRAGKHLLVQGPPGTGKSQTIANIIAAAVADGKKVLFVAEKMAALDVVKRRLDRIEVGVACLELHSNKANKRVLLEELKRTWQLGAPRCEHAQHVVRQLTESRDALNEHVTKLHTKHIPSDLTPYQVIGELVRLKRVGHSTSQLALEGATEWLPYQKAERTTLLSDLSLRVGRMGIPCDHAWYGVRNDGLLPNDRDRLIKDLAELRTSVESWLKYIATLAGHLDTEVPCQFGDARLLLERANLLVSRPSVGHDAFLSPIWRNPADADQVVSQLEFAQACRAKVAEFAPPSLLAFDWSQVDVALAELPRSFILGEEIAGIVAAHEILERSKGDLARLSQIFREASPLTLDTSQRLAALAERASSMPDLQREAFVSNVWERGIESIAELVDAIDKVQTARKALANVLNDTAWSTDVAEARGHIASLGGSWLRFFSGNWRRSNRLVKSLCTSPRALSHEELLGALDVLISAQAAQKQIASRDAQGSEAFGANWERERSNVDFLRGAAAWMRELRPLGLDARHRLAGLADRELASDVGKRLRTALGQLRDLLKPINERFIADQKLPWGDETLVGRVPLEAVREKCGTWRAVCSPCAEFVGGPNQSVETLLYRIETIKQARAAIAILNDIDAKGRSAFGEIWDGIESRPHELRQAISWMEANPKLRELAARTPNPAALLEAAKRGFVYAERLRTSVLDLFTQLDFQGTPHLDRSPDELKVHALAHQLGRWQGSPEGFPEWVTYLVRANEGRRKGLGSVIEALESGAVSAQDANAVFDLAYYEAVLAAQIREWPELARFDGLKHSQLVEKFVELDKRRISHSVRQVLAAHHERLPKNGGAAGPTGVLRAEMERSRRHMPIRQLMQRCAPAIQALKPVFMMSPLSVAQFLPPGAVEFDLLVVDEASQIQPVDALGAIARAKQLVIVGDERQLPPTRFFAKLLADERDDDEQGASTADIESILGLCRARGLPQRMLRWHYRSRHQSLIAVSNSQFYESKLFIVPSPFNEAAGMGLRLRHMPENIYARGDTSVNAAEAKAVASAVIEHARNAPELSLGVATFSTKQRRAIMDELELLRRQQPDTEAFFASHPDEPFFIKNLENIQGDERDVVFISVGYGRDAQGKVSMQFGPLTSEGGERRLNVLISRAKRRCEVFSSITDEDIDLERTKSKGAAAFKLFLHYARTGRLSVVPKSTDGVHDMFEQQVAEALKESGYNVHPHIGTAGCFVDLAVADPERPGQYVLGIECDGASYAGGRSARDRDRLRKAVLEDQGWIIHRIWSSDWFHRPAAELERLVAAIENAKSELGRRADHPAPPSRAVPVSAEVVERGEQLEIGLTSGEAEEASASYREADFRNPHSRYELHEVPSGLLANVVHQVVQIEGPVHRDEVVVRIRNIWGLQRAGGRIQAAVDAGIAHAVSMNKVVVVDGEFLLVPGQEIKVRDRSGVRSQTLRRVDYLPPREIDSALRNTITENLGATVSELVTCVSRALGFRSTSAQLREAIEARAHYLATRGVLRWRGEHLELANGDL